MTKMQLLPNLCEILEKRENKHEEKIDENGEATGRGTMITQLTTTTHSI